MKVWHVSVALWIGILTFDDGDGDGDGDVENW